MKKQTPSPAEAIRIPVMEGPKSRAPLTMEAEVPRIDEKTFLAKAEEAKIGCPISKALAAVPKIVLNAKLLAAR